MWNEWETYEVTGLSAATSKDENGLGACARTSVLELVLGRRLAGFEFAGLESVDFSGLWGCDGGGNGHGGEEDRGEELHGEGLGWWLVGWRGWSEGLLDD
jgi:hypothetical protein